MHSRITLSHVEDSIELQDMKDIALGSNARLPYKKSPAGNIMFSHAHMVGAEVYIHLHACYIGDIVLRLVTEE